MSELLSAAAAALGLPEPLVRRSAEARAAETGTTVDEVLTAWAGGAPAPTASPTAGEAEESPVDEGVPPEGDQAPATPEAPPPTAPTPPAAEELPEEAMVPYRPPVLVGAADKPLKMFAGVVGLFLVVLLVALIGPSVPIDSPGERTSALPFGALAEEGRSVYVNLGCAACHTQMVRPVIADVGLGAVTLNDTNQVLGSRRFGPDLANVGARLNQAETAAVVAGAGGHPPHNLREEHLEALVAYLSESVTMGDR